MRVHVCFNLAESRSVVSDSLQPHGLYNPHGLNSPGLNPGVDSTHMHTHVHTQRDARACMHTHAHAHTDAHASTHVHTHTIRYGALLLRSSQGTAAIHLTAALAQKVSDSGPSCGRIQPRRAVGDATWRPVGRASYVAGSMAGGQGSEFTRRQSSTKRVFAAVGLSVKGTPGFKMPSAQVRCMRQGAQGWCTGMTLRDGMGREVGGSQDGEHMYTHGRFM